MCCHTGRHQSMDFLKFHSPCSCGCQAPMGPRPRFMTKAQMIGKLDQHLETLQNEVTAVKEQIAELKKKG